MKKEIVNVFATLTNEEKERWKMEVMPIRSALSKVSALIVTWRLLTWFISDSLHCLQDNQLTNTSSSAMAHSPPA